MATAAPITFILLKDLIFDQADAGGDRISITHQAGSLLVTSTVDMPTTPGCVLLQAISDPVSDQLHITGRQMEVRLSSIVEVPSRVVSVLRAIPKQCRLKFFMNKIRLEEIDALKPGSRVGVFNKDGLPDGAEAIVRYRGELEEEQGTWFGVELAAEFSGRGTTDGTWRRDLCFSCAEDCGLFLNGSQLRAENPAYPTPLDIGHRVSLWSDDDVHPTKGTVKWLGFLDGNGPPSLTSITAGVECDHPVGSGSGMYRGKRLFLAGKNRAVLSPVGGLIPECEMEVGLPQTITASIYNNTMTGDVHKTTAANDISIITNTSGKEKDLAHVDLKRKADQVQSNQPLPTENSDGSRADPGVKDRVNVQETTGAVRYPVAVAAAAGDQCAIQGRFTAAGSTPYSESFVQRAFGAFGGLQPSNFLFLSGSMNRFAQPPQMEKSEIRTDVTPQPEMTQHPDTQLEPLVVRQSQNAAEHLTSPEITQQLDRPADCNPLLEPLVVKPSQSAAEPAIPPEMAQQLDRPKVCGTSAEVVNTLAQNTPVSPSTIEAAPRETDSETLDTHETVVIEPPPSPNPLGENDKLISGPPDSELTIGDRVKVFSEPPELYGTIRWIGYFPGNPKKIAGVEMDEPNRMCYTTGSYGGMHLFKCDSGEGDGDDNSDCEYRAYFCCKDQLKAVQNNVDNAQVDRQLGD